MSTDLVGRFGVRARWPRTTGPTAMRYWWFALRVWFQGVRHLGEEIGIVGVTLGAPGRWRMEVYGR